MTVLKLNRFGSIPGIGTFSELVVGNYTFHTVEREYLDNKPFVSSVPEGLYTLEPHSSTKYGQTWALVGDTVSHYKSSKERYACLFHAANWPEQVQGCIGVGATIMHIYNGDHHSLGVTNSRNSMKKLRSLLDKSNHSLIIKRV